MERTQISKTSLITWLMTILMFISGLVATSWMNTHHKIRALELDVQTLKVKVETHENELIEMRINLKDIKQLLHEIDKKVSHIK